MKVQIETDELYLTVVRKHDDDELPDPPPHYYLPVEIPDELFQRHEAAWAAWRAVVGEIAETYGHSERDPDYGEKHRAYWQRTSAPAPDHPDPETAWAEYYEQYPLEADPDTETEL